MRAFVVLGFVFPYQAKRLAWRTSPKWPILCRVGCKTTTQSISPSWISGPWCWLSCPVAGVFRYSDGEHGWQWRRGNWSHYIPVPRCYWPFAGD